MHEAVVAVVVTFNRKRLLRRCLDALLSQKEKLSKVIIIDNGSEDGTQEMLEEAGLLDRRVIEYRLLDKNIGGAGGFQLGVELAVQIGFDWVWLMDDDGWPDADCLYELKQAYGLVKGPVVIDEADVDSTAFGYLVDGRRESSLKTVLCGTDISPIHPFNGVLLAREVVERIGTPDKRFFLWGDERDYRERWLAASYQEKVVKLARFFHPRDRQVISRLIGSSIGVPLGAQKLRRYCYYRNQIYLQKRRIGTPKLMIKVMLTLPDLMLHEEDFGIFVVAMCHGLTGKFPDPLQYA
jgi:rhamnopyranosyl-N-acetylglucosaminyl-diphospho-decaprenol beta-1,3/1,4-galactofuranosyltransferase